MEWFKTFRKTRESLGLSQEQAARELNTTARTIARWEKGLVEKPKLVELQHLERLLGAKHRRQRAGRPRQG